MTRSRSEKLLPLPQLVEWLGFSFCVPEGWEIVRHGLSPELGSLRFVDRRRERLALSWTECRTRPDLGRLLEEMGALPSGAGPLSPFRCGAWQGVVQVRPDGTVVTHVVTHHDATSRLLEARIFGAAPEESDGRALARAILERFVVTSAAEHARRWRAFDLCVTTPESFALLAAEVSPGDVRFRFEARGVTEAHLAVQATAQRLGMAGAWFDGDSSRVLRAKLAGVELGAFTPASYRGVPATYVEGKVGERPLTRLLGRSRVARALAWHVADEQAVYLLSTRGPYGQTPDPRDFEVDFATCAQRPGDGIGSVAVAAPDGSGSQSLGASCEA